MGLCCWLNTEGRLYFTALFLPRNSVTFTLKCTFILLPFMHMKRSRLSFWWQLVEFPHWGQKNWNLSVLKAKVCSAAGCRFVMSDITNQTHPPGFVPKCSKWIEAWLDLCDEFQNTLVVSEIMEDVAKNNYCSGPNWFDYNLVCSVWIHFSNSIQATRV